MYERQRYRSIHGLRNVSDSRICVAVSNSFMCALWLLSSLCQWINTLDIIDTLYYVCTLIRGCVCISDIIRVLATPNIFQYFIGSDGQLVAVATDQNSQLQMPTIPGHYCHLIGDRQSHTRERRCIVRLNVDNLNTLRCGLAKHVCVCVDRSAQNQTMHLMKIE